VGWRRERDSNPRAPVEANGFQDRRFQPLTHPSDASSLAWPLTPNADALCRPFRSSFTVVHSSFQDGNLGIRSILPLKGLVADNPNPYPRHLKGRL
jgi:hypothetical protein